VRRSRARSCFAHGLFLALSLVLGVAARPREAFAQPPSPSSADLAHAKKLFETGLRAKREGRFDDALEAFQEANAIAPRESIQNNIALTYRLEADMAQAYTAYETLLALYGATMKPQLREETQRALEALEVLTGQLTVAVDEPGARVVVDGKPAGATPLAKPLRLNLGTHAVLVAKDGFDSIERSIDVHGHDSARIDGPLVKTTTTGHVAVDVKQTTPPDATVHVLVDGKDVGAPPYAGDLPPGAHTIDARGTSAVSPTRRLQVDRSGKYDVSLVLHARSGTLAVTVDVPDSEIALDGHVVGHGAFEGPFTAGTHALVVTKAGYPPYRKDVVVNDGERVVEEIPLHGAAARAGPLHDWKGPYARVDFIGQLGATKPTNDIAQGVGYAAGTPIATSSVFGGFLGVRAGYSLGAVGVEGAVLLGYDHSSSNVTVGPGQATVSHLGPTPRTEDYEFHRVGGGAALGLRLMPKTRVVRPTLGVAGGASLKGIFYRRTVTIQSAELSGSYSQMTNPAFYLAPTLLVDAGIEIGSTPSTRFYVGALMVADFARALPVGPSAQDQTFPSPPAGLDAVNGTEVFVGPVLGVQLGE
jgi:hypothetical protein